LLPDEEPEKFDAERDPDALMAAALSVPVKVGLALNATLPEPVVPATVVPCILEIVDAAEADPLAGPAVTSPVS
jgi:hypothetical protein